LGPGAIQLGQRKLGLGPVKAAAAECRGGRVRRASRPPTAHPRASIRSALDQSTESDRGEHPDGPEQQHQRDHFPEHVDPPWTCVRCGHITVARYLGFAATLGIAGRGEKPVISSSTRATAAGRFTRSIEVRAREIRGPCRELSAQADDIVCAATTEPFVAVGRWYADFEQTTDEEVRALFEAAEQAGRKQRSAPIQGR
jgi:hypothetical protein